MQQEISKTTMIVAVLVAVAVLGGLGWWFTMGRSPEATGGNSQPVMPPGGYGGLASGPGAGMSGGGGGAPVGPGSNGGR